MRSPARVTSIDLLRNWQAALATFRTDALDALTTAGLDVRRSFDWLEGQRRAWSKAVRERYDEVTQAKAALARKQWVLPGQRQPDITEEMKALRLAQRRLAEAEDKVAVTKRWSPALQRAVDEFEGPMRRLADLMEGDLPKAGSLIERLIADLEAYLALNAGSVKPVPASPFVLNPSAGEGQGRGEGVAVAKETP
jgi:hypothetical protein